MVGKSPAGFIGGIISFRQRKHWESMFEDGIVVENIDTGMCMYVCMYVCMHVCMLRLYVNYSVVDGVGEAINELITSDLDEVKKGKKN